MAKIEANVDNMKQNIDLILVKLEHLPDEMDKRYASKSVEKVVYGALGIILTGFLVSIIELVSKH